MPNLEAELQKHKDHTHEDILDGGVLPVNGKSNLPNAEKFIVVQSSQNPDFEVGIISLLNILDAAELMKAGTVSIPMLSSFPPAPSEAL